MAAPPNVVLIAFNRPDLTQRTLQRVLCAEVAQVWVALDGPRPSHPPDEPAVEAVKEVVRGFSDARVQIDAAERNLGLRRNFERGIDRLIGEHGRGVVLEDDTLPDPSFFPYVSTLLERYADDERVAAVSGQSLTPPHGSSASYSFSHIMPPWAWATWERAWRDYERNLQAWPDLGRCGRLSQLVGAGAAREWGAIFDHADELDSYWIRWVLTNWAHERLSIVPAVNLVTNIGVDERGTHTTPRSRYARFAEVPTEPISLPLAHPERLGIRDVLEEQRVVESALPFSPLRRRIKQLVLEGPAGALRSWALSRRMSKDQSTRRRQAR